MSRFPWWQKNLRDDKLCLTFKNLKFQTLIDPLISSLELDIQSVEVLCNYIDKNSQSIQLLRVSQDEASLHSNEVDFEWPR